MDSDDFRALNAVDAQRRGENRLRARGSFADALKRASELGLSLVRRNDTHYQLRPLDRSWLINLYPGNNRIYRDAGQPKAAPFLDVRHDWTLLDIVEAAGVALAIPQLWRYVLAYRPATACRLPAGWSLMERGTRGEYPRRLDLPEGRTMFGVVAWQRELTKDEIEEWLFAKIACSL